MTQTHRPVVDASLSIAAPTAAVALAVPVPAARSRRRALSSSAFALAALALASGCGGTGGDPSSDAPSSPRGGGAQGTPGSDPSPAPGASPLDGTWDVVAGIGTRVEHGTIVVSPTAFSLTWDSFHTDADVAGLPKVSFELPCEKGSVTTTHIDEPLDLGQVPYALGGAWSFRGEGSDACTARVTPAAVTLDCANLVPPLESSLQGYDWSTHKPLGSGSSSAQRGPKLPSIFGELGGEWVVLMPRARCNVKFEGNRLDGTCDTDKHTNPPRPGTVSLTFVDGLASGTSNEGELSARRR